jgi:DNA-binding transcriptional LysR family regulator
MEFHQLAAFVAVAEAGTIAIAAKRLHITQPAITRKLHKLEADLGVQLFDRTHNRMILTAAGRHFLWDAREILAMVDHAYVHHSRRYGQG